MSYIGSPTGRRKLLKRRFSGKIEDVSAIYHKIRDILFSRWLPWLAVASILVAALLHEVFLPDWIGGLSRTGQALLWVAALLLLFLSYWIIARFGQLVDQRDQLQRQVENAGHLVGDAYQRLEALFRVNQRFVEANDEDEVIEPVLSLLVEMIGAQGAAFVPLDEHGHPQTALSRGDIPYSGPSLDGWLEHLASPGVRERCKNCELRNTVERPDDCPLLREPFAQAASLICFSVRRGEHEFGVLTLFVPDGVQLDERTQAFLRALVDETALGLEGIRLRRREMAVLRQMQFVRQKTDLDILLNGLLENVYRMLEADCAILIVSNPGKYHPRVDLLLGTLSAQSRPFLDGILQGVMASGEPVLLGELSGNIHGLRSLLAAPLMLSDGQVVGALLAGARAARGFQQRQLYVLQTIAGQAALVVQSANSMAELEYKTMIQERTRLAREIHDGLAQTLGFLKLQMAQIRGYVGHGDGERARQAVDLCYQTLSDAYLDARQAIDGLRLSPDECGLPGWLGQVAADFYEVSGLPVDLQEVDAQIGLLPEVQAQLIRIVQEALSNVRKHAHAQQVWIACREDSSDLLLEVRDDGEGFAPEDVAGPSQYGLRGMRERADLIGADFQIISQPNQGTILRLRLPLDGLRVEELQS